MADSLCGPSNALQNFQKHSTVDRTLQQDRLIARQSPSQGFRSSQQNGALSEPEFQAFQQGNLPLESQQGLQPPHFSHAPQNLQQPGPVAWASDFQRMHISSPPPQEQFRPQVIGGPVQRQDTGGWHQDFARQFGAEQRVMAQTSQIGGSFSQGYSPMNGGMGMGMGLQSQYGGGIVEQQVEQQNLQQQPAEAFDEEAFARAFEEASKSEMNTREELQERSDTRVEVGQDVMFEESAERFMSDPMESTTESQIPNQARLGADLIHDPRSETQEQPQHEDPDALARTAGQLLDSVRNNQSSKFQNSEFLELMRQLRDREVVVKGDDIIGTHEGGQGDNVKNDIIDLLQSMKALVLLRDRIIAGNASEQVRKVLIILLRLNRSSATGTDAISYDRIQKMMQAVINSRDLDTRPALRDLANLTLHAFETAEKAKSNALPTPLSSPLEAIRTANGEITSILPPTNTALDTLIYNYISDSLQGIQSKKESQDPLDRLLGYTFVDHYGNHPQPSGTHNVHIQRARDIMGPAISDTIDACRGFWCPLLSVQNFFALVAAHQLHGGLQSPGFKIAIEEVEREIEEGYNLGLRRVEDGFPYRYGVSTLGLQRKEAMSFEEQMEALEAQGRLRVLQANREQRQQREKREQSEYLNHVERDDELRKIA